ncbi:MAG: bifunctional sulfate adenylyltransferase/adenylylsulfate kinase [Desulfobulbaceae bacterium]|nr:MAG: bifunctional sulfate adenylyltransferase/adenylylsulfate kinase [Desulfobulbaceae bacterium]
MKRSDDYSESLVVHFRRAEVLRREALELAAIDLNERQLFDLELLLNRGFYPLSGYLNRAEYDSVLSNLSLPDGTTWPMPICLDVTEQVAASVSAGQRIVLNDQEGFLLAILTISDIWKPDKKLEATAVYGTDDAQLHPGVHQLYHQVNDWYIGGMIEGVALPVHYDFLQLRLTPTETVRRFTMNGWRRILGFHTEEYLHCAHREMLMDTAKSVGAAIFLQPVVGLDHPGDVDFYTHIRCYQLFTQKFPPNMIMMGLSPYASRKAGPRDALLQAIMRRNFGCSHFVVAPDHADPFAHINGPDSLFYEKGAAQQLVAEHSTSTGIEMVPQVEYSYRKDTAKYFPSASFVDDESKELITSAELQKKIVNNQEIPEYFTWPDIVKELQYAFPPRAKQGFTVFMTGLSGSGKSTIAKVLLVKFMEMRDRPVTLLDGDIVRQNLSSELTFSREHRDLNVTRIGFVASEITKNGGIALCAPIAPYDEPRQANRSLISRYGGYIEVYVATPLEVCEQRDRKGLYAKARSGKVKGVTGITDPYIPPSKPDITIDTSLITPMEAVQEILIYLQQQGYLE